MIDGLSRDVHYAVRRLRRRPGFASFTILILALGIGATAAVAGIGNALLLQALPYADGDRLVSLYEANAEQGMEEVYTSLPIVNDWIEGTTSFEQIGAAYTPASLVLSGDGEPERLRASLVSPAFFRAVGVDPEVGRFFLDGEHVAPGGHPVVVVSHELWQTRFGADREVLGRALILNGQPYVVVGVAPARFTDFPNASQETDLWVPLMMADVVLANDIVDNRRARTIAVIARLRDGVDIDVARQDLEAVGDRLAVEYPEHSSGWKPLVRTVHEQYFGDFRAPVIVLFAGAAFLLLISAANVANLILLRAAECRREVAMRVALGASRRELTRQLMAEGLMIAVTGGLLGILAAAAGTGALAGLSPIEFPPHVEFDLGPGVLAGALLISVLTGVFIGLAPLSQVSEGCCAIQIVAGKSVTVGAGSGLRRSLVVAEVAIAVVLLLGAGLMLRSFSRLSGSDVGFRTDSLMTLQLRVPSELHADDRLAVVARELIDRASALPGVERADLWSPHVPGQAFWYTRVRPQDRPNVPDDELVGVRYHYVGPGALEGLGLRFTAGRGIGRQDRAGSRPVVVLSESLAEALWPGRDPLGKVLRRWNRESWTTVVGVVEDAKHSGLQGRGSEFSRDIYFSFMQEPERDWVLLARTNGDAAVETASLRAAIAEVLPELPIFDARTMEDRFAGLSGVPRFTALIAGLYAGFAMLLATVGLYSVVAYSVTQRRREIGLRMALGARAVRVVREVVGGGLRWTFVGVAIGVVAAGGLAQLLRSVLFQVSPTDPLTFVVIPTGLLIVALIACLVPARRATKIDPMRTLRVD